ncbi:MAG: carbamate kinase [Desulfuromonadales bacterium]|jgi:carbamate kinase
MRAARKKVAIVALGGNALIRPGERGEFRQQIRHVRESVVHLPLLLRLGYNLVVTHGNGPTVGHLLLQNEMARDTVPPMPLDVCDADSEGGIGYLTQQALVNELFARAGGGQVVSLITQVVVDPKDSAFTRPTKPVGPYYSAEEAERLRHVKGWVVEEDAGRGFRRMVASPRPLEVVEEKAVRILLRNGVVVVAAGGGGIPVVRRPDGRFEGVEAVIDKDLASALLARRLGASLLVILTAEEFVYRHFGRKEQEAMPLLDTATARELLEAGEFPPGSMEPKIRAAVEFLERGEGEVIITLPERLAAALNGDTGTRIVP